MKLEPNLFLKGLRDKEKQIGLWVSLSSPIAAEAVAPSGYDWALIDMEHSLNDYFSVFNQLQTFAASNTTGLVRPEWNNPVVVKRLLDLGVQGLLFPMINSVEEAKAAVASTRYPPKGTRGIAGVTRATKFGRVSDYIERVDDETAILLQLETVDAVNQAEEIAAVDGVDGVFFGPGDIAADLGKTGKPMDPEVWDFIKPAAKKLIDKGVSVGTLSLDAAFAADLLEEGFTYVACGMDSALLAKGADALLSTVKNKLSK